MKIYHGTSDAALPDIMRQGLRPRGDEPGNWQGTAPAHPDMVYLTNTYALHFAQHAAGEQQRPAIVELDLRSLDVDRLHPDEDYVEQACRLMSDPPEWWQDIAEESMLRRTAIIRANLSGLRHAWRESLKSMGTVAHRGTIPPRCITRAVILNEKSDLYSLSDPSISILNHQVRGEYYRNLSRWVMGEFVTADDLHDAQWWTLMQKVAPGQKDRLNQVLLDQDFIVPVDLASGLPVTVH